VTFETTLFKRPEPSSHGLL